MSCMFKKQLIVIAIVDCMSYCYNDVIVSMYLIVIPSDSMVGSLFKRCFTPVMSVHSYVSPVSVHPSTPTPMIQGPLIIY